MKNEKFQLKIVTMPLLKHIRNIITIDIIINNVFFHPTDHNLALMLMHKIQGI